MTAGHLTIGPVRFSVQVAEGASVRYDDPAYAGFWHETKSELAPEPLTTLPVTITRDVATLPTTEPLYRGGKNWAIWEQGSDYVISSGFYESSCPRFQCRVGRDYASAEVALDPAREGVDPDPYVAPLRYPLDQILSWGLLAGCGGVLLHGAVAVKDGQGWVFTGRSGAGKSTLSELCHRQGWRILNDDRCMIFPRDGRYQVAGTPWHGSGRFAEAAEVPLAGVIFLRHATEDILTPLSTSDARLACLDVAAIPWFAEEASSRSLDTVAHLFSVVPAYRLDFTPTPAAVDLLQDQMERGLHAA